MKKQFILLVMIVMTCAFQFACFGLVGPTDPDKPEETKRYDYRLTYIRTEITDPKGHDPKVPMIRNGLSSSFMPQFTKIDDFKFVAEFSLQTIRLTDGPQSVYIVDSKRWKSQFVEGGETWGIPHSVGYIIIIENLTTGHVTQLAKIVPNTYFANYLATKAEMAQFWNLADGSIISPPNSNSK